MSDQLLMGFAMNALLSVMAVIIILGSCIIVAVLATRFPLTERQFLLARWMWLTAAGSVLLGVVHVMMLVSVLADGPSLGSAVPLIDDGVRHWLIAQMLAFAPSFLAAAYIGFSVLKTRPAPVLSLNRSAAR